MYSMLPSPYTHNNYYTPSKPSPLSSSPLRSSPLKDSDANVLVPSSPPQYRDDMMCSSSPSRPSYPYSYSINQGANTSVRQQKNTMSLATPPSQPHTPKQEYSKRASKPNPLFQGSNEGRETRRKLFLKRVRETAEEKRWRDRGVGGEGEEEVMRCIWMQEERKREEGRRREAMGVQVDEEVGVGEGEGEEDISASLDEMMADEVARDEEREVEEYLERIPDARTNQGSEFQGLVFGEERRREEGTSTETLYGSDDEYDEIFMDVIEEEQRNSSSEMHERRELLSRQPTPAYVDDGEMMDMS